MLADLKKEHGPVIGRYAMLGTAEVLARVIGFAATLVVVFRFGDAGFGRVTFAASVVMYALFLSVFGTDIYAVRWIAREPGHVGRAVSTMMALRLVVAAIVMALLLLVAMLSSRLRQDLGLIAVFGGTLVSGAVTINWVPQALQRFSALAVASLGTQALYLLLLLAAVWLRTDLWVVPTAQVLAETAVAIGLLVWLRARVTRWARPAPLREWWTILVDSAPIGGARFLRMFALGSDLVLLGFLVSNQDLGWYGGAYKLFMLCVSLGALYFVILLPRLVQAAARPGPGLRDEVASSQKCVLVGSLALAAALMLLSRPLLETLFPAPFSAATNSLRVLIVAFVIGQIHGHYRNTLLAVGRQRTDLLLVAITSTAHVGLKLALIPWLGILGAAVGTLIGETLLAILGWAATRRELAAGASQTSTSPAPAQLTSVTSAARL